MSTKTKKSLNTSQTVAQTAGQLGTLLMAAAVTLGLFESPDHLNSKVVLPNQPSLVYVGSDNGVNPVRREREETAPHFISYSEVQRTPSRSGRI